MDLKRGGLHGLWLPGYGVFLPEDSGRFPPEIAMNLKWGKVKLAIQAWVEHSFAIIKRQFSYGKPDAGRS